MTELLEAKLVSLYREKGLTLAAAESCTGGLIAKRITDVPGASHVFLGGVVSYTNGVKHRVLGVPQELLDEFGAVSEPVAAAMAEGVRRITGADVGVSVTGCAGPDRDDRDNPVGTVYVGIATAESTRVITPDVGQESREEIRRRAADEVLKLASDAGRER